MTIGISLKELTKTALALSALETAMEPDKRVLTADREEAVKRIGANVLATLPLDLYPYIVDANLAGDVLTLDFGERVELTSGLQTMLRMAIEQLITYHIMQMVTGKELHKAAGERLIKMVKETLRGERPGASGGRKWYF